MLRGRDVVMTGVSAIIGVGLFVGPGKMAAGGASPAAVLCLFAAAGGMAIWGR